MLDFRAQHGVASDIEVIPIQQINEAYERMLKGNARYRFVMTSPACGRSERGGEGAYTRRSRTPSDSIATRKP
jgi:hypothetical protein